MNRRWAALALAMVMALASGGCAFLGGAAVGAAALAGGYKYTEGNLETTYKRPYDEVYNATLATLKDSNMPVTKAEKDAAGAHISAKRQDGTNVKIDLSKTAPDKTDATIRVGYLGDENASKVIANNITKGLEEGRGAKSEGQTGGKGAGAPAGGTPSGAGSEPGSSQPIQQEKL